MGQGRVENRTRTPGLLRLVEAWIQLAEEEAGVVEVGKAGDIFVCPITRGPRFTGID